MNYAIIATSPATQRTQIPHVKNVTAVNTVAMIDKTNAAVPRPSFSLDLLIPLMDKIRPVTDNGSPITEQIATPKPVNAIKMPRMPRTKPAIFKRLPIFLLLS